MVVCPVECILVDPDHTETREQLQAKFELITAETATETTAETTADTTTETTADTEDSRSLNADQSPDSL